MFTMRLFAISLLAPLLVPIMIVSSMAQIVSNQVISQNEHIYQGGPKTVVPHGRVGKIDRWVQATPSESRRQGCRHLYSGGPKSPVPHTC